VDTDNPDRGPLLIISGEKDNTAPHALSHAAFTREQRNPGVTVFAEIPGRGHALTIDSCWREVAQTALAFIRRFTQENPGPPRSG
jgi:non-heme chloroperoxidase